MNSQTINTLQPTAVETNGQLRIEGKHLINKNGEIVALHGMSLFWSQWGGDFFNKKCVQWLVKDWKCNIIRAPLGITYDGYLNHKKREQKKIFRVIDAAIESGIYVVVDWHDHNAEDHKEEAKEFFETVAKKYGRQPNIIYEIYNEPLEVSWNDVIKPYAEEIIQVIRKHDPENIIIVGTGQYSQDVDEVAGNELQYKNIAYALHFYSGTHTQWLRDKAQIALDNNLPLFISEWGVSDSDAQGEFDHEETDIWLDFISKNKLSTCNWSVFSKDETTSVLKEQADKRGNWDDSDLTETGIIVRKLIRSLNSRQSPE